MVVNCMIDLELQAEYSNDQVIEMRELNLFCRTVINRYNKYTRSETSALKESRTLLTDHEPQNDDLIAVRTTMTIVKALNQ